MIIKKLLVNIKCITEMEIMIVIIKDNIES